MTRPVRAHPCILGENEISLTKKGICPNVSGGTYAEVNESSHDRAAPMQASGCSPTLRANMKCMEEIDKKIGPMSPASTYYSREYVTRGRQRRHPAPEPQPPCGRSENERYVSGLNYGSPPTLCDRLYRYISMEAFLSQNRNPGSTKMSRDQKILTPKSCGHPPSPGGWYCKIQKSVYCR